ncbi:MAG: aminotransferase class I/II-fold pyridoxal phosphate-dependent enzyme [bacterium]
MSYKIYFYGKQNISLSDIWSVIKVLKSDYLTQGPKVKEFEQAICDYTGAKYCVAVSNGTAALHLAVAIFNLNFDDEVITTPISFVATSNSILYSGANVVFADIDSKTANIDTNEVLKKITNKTKGIIPVHYAGQSCDMESISKIAKEHNLFVIEDAAHAIGSLYKGVKVGSCKYSDITTFSFHPVKTITTGEGGAITTNNKDIYEKLLMLRSHGITRDKTRFVIPGLIQPSHKVTTDMAEDSVIKKTFVIPDLDPLGSLSRVFEGGSSSLKKSLYGPWYYEQQELGFNYRLPDINAALGISQLKRLDKFVKRRREIVEFYKNEFANDDRFSFLQESKDSKAAFHLFPLLINFEKIKINKEKLFLKLQENGLNLQVHYIPIHLQPYYRQLGFNKGEFSNAEEFYEQEISLPLYVSLNRRDVLNIVEIINKIVK